MNNDTASSSLTNNLGGTNAGSTSLNGVTAANGGVVQRMAAKAHEAVDKLEQTVSSGSEKVTGWQEEYGGVAREQIKANPLTAVGIAFAAGILFNRILGS